MDYEKKYKEALEKAKKTYNNPNASKVRKEWIESFFPEFAESEDEKTRKFLINFIKLNNELNLSQDDTDKLLAWIEKQGEQKPVEWSDKDERMFGSALWHIKNSCGNQGKNSGEFEVYNWAKSLKDRVQPQQKLEWSEEDESWFKELELMALSFSNDDSYRKKFFDWLKSLKSRVQSKQEWSEEDERNFQGIVDEIEANKNHAPDYEVATYDRFLSWLKDLKDKVQPQPKWSKEDERNIKELLYLVEADYLSSEEPHDRLITWLKSLRPQNRWKPSEEQMELLREVQQELLGKDCHNRFVNFMYELKRLREK